MAPPACQGKGPLWLAASRGKCDTLSQGFHSWGFLVQFWHANMILRVHPDALSSATPTNWRCQASVIANCYWKTLSFEECRVHKSHSGWSFCRISSISSWWSRFQIQNIPPHFWGEFLFPQLLLSQADFLRQRLTLSDSILTLIMCGQANFLVVTPKFILWEKPKK